MYLLIALVLNILSLMATAYLVPGFEISGPQALILAAIIIGVLNTFIRPVLLIISAPINILTLGLFTFVVNAVILRMAAIVVSGFRVDGWGTAILSAVVLAVVSTTLSLLVKDLRFGGRR